MKTRNLVIYHCLSCGAVMHCEPEEEVPQCCARSMIKAAAETVSDGQGEALTNAGRNSPPETPRDGNWKPR